MSIETELKLRVKPAELARLKRHEIFRRHRISRPVVHRLYNVYFDTPALDLRGMRAALRLRKSGRQWLQTFKGGGKTVAGLHQREELEFPVAGNVLDFSLLPEEKLPTGLRKSLQPLFTTDFYRSSFELDWHGARIEVCMDRGVIATMLKSEPICEIELELKSGKQRALFEFAEALLQISPFELECVSKAEKGYRLLAEYEAGPEKFALPAIGKSDSLADALQALIAACLQHFQDNLIGADCSCHDAEYLHQMRVAIRRLRVALRMAEKLRSDKELAFLRDMAGNIGRMLGSMREWDVFIAGVVLPAMTSMEGNAGKVLLKACEDKRAGLCARLDPVMLQRFLLRSGIWMSGEYWKKAGRAGPSLVGFSQRIMRRLHSSSKHFGDELHALRIRLKKLRYSGEFFSALYHRKKAASYLSALSRAQDELGLINDIAVSHKLLEEMEKDMPRQRKAIAVLRKKLDGDMPVSKMRLEKALKNLDLQQPFWK